MLIRDSFSWPAARSVRSTDGRRCFITALVRRRHATRTPGSLIPFSLALSPAGVATRAIRDISRRARQSPPIKRRFQPRLHAFSPRLSRRRAPRVPFQVAITNDHLEIGHLAGFQARALLPWNFGNLFRQVRDGGNEGGLARYFRRGNFISSGRRQRSLPPINRPSGRERIAIFCQSIPITRRVLRAKRCLVWSQSYFPVSRARVQRYIAYR